MTYRYGPLGRRIPTDFQHVEKYPLTAALAVGTPGVLGLNWHSSFDQPEKIGNTWWIGRGQNGLGLVRGGHAICCKPHGIDDRAAWWSFYDQGTQGACVGFSESRMMTLLTRRRYDATWLYDEAQIVDEYPDTPPAEGTSVRAGFNILRTQGAKRVNGTMDRGISTYRWATDWNDIRAVLAVPDTTDGVALLNSWGRGYPHTVRITDEAGAQVLAENGEFGVPTRK